jgi:short-subunit dehydrogenase
MAIRLKKLKDQVMVITGASSGIGLATARMAARRGARLVLAARNQAELQKLCDEIGHAGGEARWVGADVARHQDLLRVAAEATGYFGRFDTWINNAGVSIYGRILDTPADDARKLFETNFWGVVHGSRIAAEHLRRSGGALINVGSVVSDVAVPLQGFYSASKHAVKGFTDALRMELEEQHAPVSVTLIKPAAINTPWTQHARNLLEDEPTHTPPVYAPELVAEAILHAAEHPVRDQFVGGGAMFMSSMGRYAPRVADKYMEKVMLPGTHSGRPREIRQDSLHSPTPGGEVHGNYEGMTRSMSAYTSASMHPLLAGALGLGATLALGALAKGRTRVGS